MFRVYDKKRKKFITEDILMNQNGDLYLIGQNLLGKKMTLLHQDRYVFQQAINLFDKNGVEIYIGDVLEATVANDEIVIGIVSFAQELSSYVIFCDCNEKWYTLGTEICDRIRVVGNIFDDEKKGKKDGKSN